MNKFIQPFLILFVFACGADQSMTVPSPVEYQQKVENGLRAAVHFSDDSSWTIEARMKHYGVPGVSMAVIHDGQIHWLKAYGIKDKDTKEAVDLSTLFQAGSISKPVAAYGALNMVEAGILSLDAPVDPYLKSWQLPENVFTEQVPVSLKQLVSHTAGLTVHGFLGYNVEEEVPTLVQVLNGEKPANSPPIFVDKLPGGDFRYSGGGYCVMQQMMIDQSGMDFPRILKERVLSPLQMDHSTYEQPLPAEKLNTAATGYLPNGEMTMGKRHTYPEMAAAGLWTTAEDLAKFAIDIQKTYKGTSHPVLSQSMVTQMLTPVSGGFIGLGIFLQDKDGEIYFEHGGWDEGFSSELITHRDKGYGVVILTNSNHPDFIDELKRSVAFVYDWAHFLPPTYEKLSLDADELEPWHGRYRFSANQIATIFQENGALFIKYPRSPKEQMFRIADNVYVRKEREKLIRFMDHPTDGKKYLVFVDEGKRDSIEFEYPLMPVSEKIPYEWVEVGEYEKALAAYKKAHQENPQDPDFSEGQINRIGYQLLESAEMTKAIDIFKINVALFPGSFNVYDSLGEGYLRAGNKELAIKYYKKSLELNPDNEGGKKALIELGVVID